MRSLKPLLLGVLCCCFGGIACDRVNEVVPLVVTPKQLRDLFPEVVRVRLSSVEAIVQLGRDDGEHQEQRQSLAHSIQLRNGSENCSALTKS